MIQTFLDYIQAKKSSVVFFDDQAYFIGDHTTEEPTGDHIVQNCGNSQVYYPLSSGVLVSDLELSDRLSNRAEINETKNRFITDNLERSDDTLVSFMNKYTLLKFVVDEIFPLLVNASAEDRLASILDEDVEVKTGEQIIKEILGEQGETTTKDLELKTHIVDQLEKQLKSAHLRKAPFVSDWDETSQREYDGTTSVLSMVLRDTPCLIIDNHAFVLTEETATDSELVAKINGKSLGLHTQGGKVSHLNDVYQTYITHLVKADATSELKSKMDSAQDNILKDVDYMPIMDLEQFSYQNLVFFRNGNIYYIGRRIPKFARQTTSDENMFVVKEHDPDGFAGDLCIGLRVVNGEIQYLPPGSYDNGVIYRGPIKSDAPFSMHISLVDPQMQRVYGHLTTICHIGGYPSFPMTAEGFVAFLDYSEGNFLDSHRQEFVDYHLDRMHRSRGLEKGTVLTKDEAVKQGYMLRNIHKIGAEDSAREEQIARQTDGDDY
ncbi:hypothetical protein HN587_01965 [Candidatus Woesearchaeota archaeon]|jgi:hypothetical protein|nr:hypothetical protein [Candidatus Woesearchaeota archaeon]